MRSALLIRHGQASFGAEDYDKLSALGEQQSRELGRWLQQTGQQPDLIVVGSMQRHIRTAELCIEAAGVTAPQLTLEQMDELDHVEIVARYRPDFSSFDAMRAELTGSADPQRAFQQLFAAAVARWTSGAHDGEYTLSWSAFRERVLHGLQTLAAHEARTIWVFTSGGPIGVIAHALIGASIEHSLALSWPLVNTSLTRVALSGNHHSLISYNSWPHLELAGNPRLVTHR
ncbi:MAG: histidine phosphatase family protein [Rhodanobacter sp.]|jgi:broad specificity phosphatase PhoE